MMELKQLEKAQKYFKKVQNLDKEILSLEKFAQSVANVDAEFKVSIKEKTEESEEDAFKRIRYTPSFGLFGMYDTCDDLEKLKSNSDSKTKPLKYNQELVDVDVLSVLGILLKSKIEQRQALLNKLEKIGVNL